LATDGWGKQVFCPGHRATWPTIRCLIETPVISLAIIAGRKLSYLLGILAAVSFRVGPAAAVDFIRLATDQLPK